MIRTGSIVRVRNLVKEQKSGSKEIGLVPTMGSLHDGHLSLIRKARRECDYVVLSIFVNPAQFSPAEDFDIYPRDLKSDLRLAHNEGVDLVFTPSVQTMYPKDYSSYVILEKITEILEGAIRPTHFRGVTTIVAKLFNIIQPDSAYFGQKDAQQLAVINTMVRELNYPIKIVRCPTVRDKRGLALSSRHQYLTPPQRKEAAGIYCALVEGVALIKSGVSDFGRIRRRIIDVLSNYGLKRIDYVSFNQWDSLLPVRKPGGKILISLAVRLGKVRLIDNIILDA